MIDERLLGPEESTQPSAIQTLGILGTGTMVSAAVLMGLQSFRGTGSLFGIVGQAGEHPLETMRQMMHQAAGVLSQGERSVSHQAEVAFSRSAENINKLHAQAQQLAADFNTQRGQQEAAVRRIVNARMTKVAQRASKQFKESLARPNVGLDPTSTGRPSRVFNTFQDPEFAQQLKLSQQAEQAIDVAYKWHGTRFPFRTMPSDEQLSPEQMRRAVSADLEMRRDMERAQEYFASEPYRPGVQTPESLAVSMSKRVSAMSPVTDVTMRRAGLLTPDLSRYDASHLLGEGQTLASLYDTTPRTSVIDRLVDITNNRLSDMTSRIDSNQAIGKDVSANIRRVAREGGEYLEFQLTIDGKSQSRIIELPNAQGLYTKPGQSRAFSVKPRLMLSNDFLLNQDDMFQVVMDDRKHPVMPAHERTVMALGNYTQKIENDILGGRSPDEVLQFFDRHIYGRAFSSKTVAGDSIEEMINKASQVELQSAENFKMARDNTTFRDSLQRGIAGFERMSRLHATGGRVFSVDTEFISPDVASDFGQRPGERGLGRTYYEVSGSIVDPSTRRSVATIDYMPDIFKPQKNLTESELRLRDEWWSDIKDFQRQQFRGSEGAFDQKMMKLRDTLTTGRLNITYKGETFDLLSGGDVPSFIPSRARGESLERYYLRAQNALLKETDTHISAGQNFASSESRFFKEAGQRSNVNIHQALSLENNVDTLDMARVLAPNRFAASQSLGNITAASMGMTENEFLTALHQIDQHSGSVGAFEGHLRERLHKNNTAAQAAIDSGKDPSKYKTRVQLYESLMEQAPRFTKGHGFLHTAAFDSMATGEMALFNLTDKAASGELDLSLRRTKALIQSMKTMGGRIGLNDRYDSHIYGEYDNTGRFQGGLYPFFNSADDASYGGGSFLPPSMLPFASLQNPVRQLYQRIKSRVLSNPVSGTGEEVFGLGRAPQGEGVTDYMGNELHRPMTYVHTNQGMRAVKSPILGGHDISTPDRLALTGGFEGSRNQATQAMASFLPINHEKVFGSRAQVTMEFSRRMQTDMVSATSPVQLNVSDTMRSEMNDYMVRAMKSRGIKPEEASELMRKHIEDIYILQKLRKDTSYSNKMHDVLDRSIEYRKQALSGNADRVTPEAKIQDVRKGLASDRNKVRFFDSRETLMSPVQEPHLSLLPETLQAPSDPRSLGIEIRIQRADPDDPSNLTMTLDTLIDEGTTQKYMLGDTNKSVTSTIYPGSALGIFGEQIVAGADYAKKKRMEMAGAKKIHIQRLRTQAVLELQEIASSVTDRARLEQRKQEVLDRFARALSKMTGGEIAPERIKGMFEFPRNAIDDVRLNLSLPFEQAIGRANLTSTMSAMKEMGLTNRSVFDKLAHAGAQHNLDVNSLTQQYRGALNETLDNLVTELDKTIKTETTDGNLDAAAEVRELKKRFTSARQGKDLFDMDDGSLFDVFVDPDTGTVSVAHTVLTHGTRMELPAVAGIAHGHLFEAATGRPTKDKTTSILASAILGHSMTTGAESGSTGHLFPAYMAAQSGATQISPKEFNRQFSRQIVEEGLDVRDFDLDTLDWDPKEKRWSVFNKETGERLNLSANPFASATASLKAQAGVFGLVKGSLDTNNPIRVGGQIIGDGSRVMNLTFDGQTDLDKNLYSVDDLQRQIGPHARQIAFDAYKQGKELPDGANVTGAKVKQQRAQARRDGLDQGLLGKALEDFVDERHPITSSLRGRTSVREVLMPVSGDRRLSNIPLYNDAYDFVNIPLYGGDPEAARVEMTRLRSQLKSLGVPDQLINRIAPTTSAIGDALASQMPDLSDQEQKKLRRALQIIRGGEDRLLTEIPLETLTGTSQRPVTQDGNYLKTRLPATHQSFIDRLDVIRTNQDAIARIAKLAADMPSNPTKAQLNEFQTEFQRAYQSGKFEDKEDLIGKAVRHHVSNAVSNADDIFNRYLGGTFKVSSSQADVTPHLKRLMEVHGNSRAFKEEVGSLLANSPYLQRFKGKDRAKLINDATRSLDQYIGSQIEMAGKLDGVDPRNVDYWRGFGASEGFMSENMAQEYLDNLRAVGKAYGDDLSPAAQQEIFDEIDPGTGKPKKPTSKMGRALATHGSEFVVSVDARFPTFTMMAGFEAAQSVVLHEAALAALGKDPDMVHMSSSPLTEWQRRGDFDGDLSYRALIDDPEVLAEMRQTKAHVQARQVYQFNTLLNVAAGGDANAIDVEGPYSTAKVLEDGRVIIPTGNERAFQTPAESLFAATGQAVRQTPSTSQARRDYAIQQAVVGNFGAISKNSAVRALQVETQYSSLMTEIMSQDSGGDLLRGALQATGYENQRYTLTSGEKTHSAYEMMLDTFTNERKFRNKRTQGAGFKGFDMIHNMFTAEGAVAQSVAIEKYKSGDQLAFAQDMHNVLKALQGRNSTYQFEEALNMAMEDKRMEFGGMRMDAYFADPSDAEYSNAEAAERRKQRFAEAARQRHNLAQSTAILENLTGAENSYKLNAANISTNALSPHEKLVQADLTQGGLFDSSVGQGSQTIGALQAFDSVISPEMSQTQGRIVAALQDSQTFVDSAFSDRYIDRSGSTLFSNIPGGAKVAAFGAAAAVVGSALFNRPDDGRATGHGSGQVAPEPRRAGRAAGEQRGQMGSPNFSRSMMDLRQQSRADATWQQLPQRPQGRTFNAPPPPTRTSVY